VLGRSLVAEACSIICLALAGEMGGWDCLLRMQHTYRAVWLTNCKFEEDIGLGVGCALTATLAFQPVTLP
jgi:hypothetical protein